MEYFGVDLDCPQLKGEVQLLGTLIYQLDKQLMGCIFPIWAIVVISASSILAVIIVIVVNRKWETIKFFMFMHFDILPNDDDPENLDEMEFDAFVTYRYCNFFFLFQKNESCFYSQKFAIPHSNKFQRFVRWFIIHVELTNCRVQV